MPITKVKLKRKNPNNPQIKSYTDAVKSGQKSYHVVSVRDGWAVKRIGQSSSSGVFATKDAAIKKAEVVARNQKSEVIIHAQNGLIQSRRSYKN